MANSSGVIQDRGPEVERWAAHGVREALSDTPVVLIHGARQTGKSTLARQVAEANGFEAVLSLDQMAVLDAARRDPEALLQSFSGPIVIDEVQRVPELALAIKWLVDRYRSPGRFLLTGSANIFALPKLADSLAGRMEVVDLHPFAVAESMGRNASFISALLEPGGWPEATELEGKSAIIERALRGGFPEAFYRDRESRRLAWFEAYLRTITERDVRDIAQIDNLTAVPRMLALLAHRVGSTLNIADLSRDLKLSHSTATRYLQLLESLFLVFRIQPWLANSGQRVVKSPKLYLEDTGLLAGTAGLTMKKLDDWAQLTGPLVENFVACELNRQAPYASSPIKLLHFRNVRQMEVDFILELPDGRIVAIEVKASSSARPEDFEGLRYVKGLVGERFIKGVLLYTGTERVVLAPDLAALPIPALWG